jgi:hypothetical protein
MEIFEGLLSERNKENCKAKIWSSWAGDSAHFFVAALQYDAVS